MAELSFNERLQPSLLDRLTDEAPEQREEARSRRVISLARLRKLVRRDLAWLLNAGHMEPLVDLSPYPAVRESALNFGIPDLSGSAVADLDREDIERIIKNAVLTYEPRILAKSLRVRADISADRMNQNAIVFEIEGQLWAQPMPAELFLKTEVDLGTGQVDVRDAADMAGGVLPTALVDPGFLRFYNNELQHLRDMGAEFAREYPKIAGRIGLDELECADPYVERLLEGFAFLAARLQLKIDKEYERFTQHLFEIVFPHFLAPVPSMCVARFEPDMNEGSLCDGFEIPRDTPLRGRIGRGEQTACEFRTRQQVTLWPIEVEAAQFLATRGDVAALGIDPPGATRSGLRLRLKTTGGFKFNETALDSLVLYLNGSGERVAALMEQLHAACVGYFVRDAGDGEHRKRFIGADRIDMPGFSQDEAVLPYGYRSFHGYRLVQEYFAFPERFNFVRFDGLAPIVSATEGNSIDLIFAFDRKADRLENTLDADNFVLNCAPVVNLFPRHCDRIHVSERDTELHVVPDRTRPMDFELHTITSVQGYRTGVHEGEAFKPFFWSHDRVADRAHSLRFIPSTVCRASFLHGSNAMAPAPATSAASCF